jgi:hypothetical protein
LYRSTVDQGWLVEVVLVDERLQVSHWPWNWLAPPTPIGPTTPGPLPAAESWTARASRRGNM